MKIPVYRHLWSVRTTHRNQIATLNQWPSSARPVMTTTSLIIETRSPNKLVTIQVGLSAARSFLRKNQGKYKYANIGQIEYIGTIDNAELAKSGGGK